MEGMGNIVESYEVRRTKRMLALPECFPGCTIDLKEDIFDQVLIRRTPFGASSQGKTIAYIEMLPDRFKQVDEFHILFRKVEPLVVAAVERFKELGVERISPYSLEGIMAIAHYPLNDQEDKEYAKLLATSGRHAAFQQTLDRLDNELKAQTIQRSANGERSWVRS